MEDRFIELLKLFNDTFTKRKLILAIGRAKKSFWFSSERRDFPHRYTKWEKRAFLAAYSCVQIDEKKHWYKAAEKNYDLDYLDIAIIKWIKKFPF